MGTTSNHLKILEDDEAESLTRLQGITALQVVDNFTDFGGAFTIEDQTLKDQYRVLWLKIAYTSHIAYIRN